ncbi:MAG: HAMP domain-containing protein, partial [Anaerolineae bacterium]|nr:HAMP domain-containing protein [Anaerolineae bacterium]
MSSHDAQTEKNHRLRPGWNLRKQLNVLILGILTVLLVGIWISTSALVNTTEATSWAQRQRDAVTDAAERIEVFLDQARSTLNITGMLDDQFLRLRPNLMQSILNSNPALLEILRVNPTGEIIQSAYIDRPILSNQFTIAQALWFENARSGQTYLSDLQVSYTGEPYVIQAVPTADGGVIVARIGVNLLWQLVASIRFGETGTAYIINQAGEIIAHSQTQLVLNRVTVPITITPSSTGEFNSDYRTNYVNFQQIPVTSLAQPVRGTDWTILVEVAESEAHSATRRITLAIGALIPVLLFLAQRITFRQLNRLILNPLEQIRVGAVEVGGGNLRYSVDVDQPQEMAQVATAFNHMVRQLQQKKEELETQTQELIREITERQQAQFSLGRSEFRNQKILDAIPDMLGQANRQGFITGLRLGVDIDDFTEEILLGKYIHDLTSPEKAADILERIQSVLDTGKISVFEHQVDLGDKTGYFEIRLIPSDEDEVLAMVRDITDRKMRETMLRDELDRQQRLNEMKQNFTTLMSHEFRTPLTIIMNSSDIIRRYSHKLTDDQKIERLDLIQQQVRHLTRTLDDILLLSKAETVGVEINRKPLNLEAVCTEIVRDFQLSSLSHQFVFRSDHACEPVALDPTLIRQAITNLFSNAIKFSPSGSRITLELDCQPDHLLIRVCDQGIGIAPEDISEIFAVFQRAQNVDNRPGIGLGLAERPGAVPTHIGPGHAEGRRRRV